MRLSFRLLWALSEVIVVDPVGPPRHVVPLVIGLRPELQMLRIDAQTVVALVTDDNGLGHRHPLQHTQNEPVAGPLTTSHLRLGVGGRGGDFKPFYPIPRSHINKGFEPGDFIGTNTQEGRHWRQLDFSSQKYP